MLCKTIALCMTFYNMEVMIHQLPVKAGYYAHLHIMAKKLKKNCHNLISNKVKLLDM